MMEISHIETEPISDKNLRSSVAPLHGFAPRAQNGETASPHSQPQDVFEMDNVRKYLRELCVTGQAQNHVDEIIASGIEPDCLRAELAFRAFQGDNEVIPIVISYLAGNFKEALQKTQQLAEDENIQKMKELLIFSDYFAGNLDKGCAAVKNLPVLNFSPFLCYAYADMLLSLGFVEDARLYRKKYVLLARRYLRGFVSEREKYENEKKRREQSSRRGNQDEKNEDSQQEEPQQTDQPAQNVKNTSGGADSAQSPALYGALKVMLERRRVLLGILKTRNVSIDKRPLLFELEDIDTKIAQATGKLEEVSQY